MHCAFIPQKLEIVKDYLSKVNSNFYRISLSRQEECLLLQYLADKMGAGHSTGNFWKMFILYPKDDSTCIKFIYCHVPDKYIKESPDFYFGEEVRSLSKLIAEKIYYTWEQHVDIGYEVFRHGERLNSLIFATHEPVAELNGKGIQIPMTKVLFGLLEKYDYSKIEEQYSEIPKNVRNLLTEKGLNRLTSEYVVFVENGIKDSKALMEKLQLKTK